MFRPSNLNDRECVLSSGRVSRSGAKMLYTLFVNGFMVDVNAVWMKCESELCCYVW